MTLAPGMEVLRLTVPLKPVLVVQLTLYIAAWPSFTDIVDGDTEMAKSATVSWALAVWLGFPLGWFVPVTVTG
jgi:hypothetical protein